MSDPDPLLRRLHLVALLWCGATAVLALVIWPRQPRIAAGVLGGGALSALSFLAIKSSLDAFLGMMGTPETDAEPVPDAAVASLRRRLALRGLVRMIGRYALLTGLAYVMIARLRLHPVGLMVGASALVASAATEAVRQLKRPS